MTEISCEYVFSMLLHSFVGRASMSLRKSYVTFLKLVIAVTGQLSYSIASTNNVCFVSPDPFRRRWWIYHVLRSLLVSGEAAKSRNLATEAPMSKNIDLNHTSQFENYHTLKFSSKMQMMTSTINRKNEKRKNKD